MALPPETLGRSARAFIEADCSMERAAIIAGVDRKTMRRHIEVIRRDHPGLLPPRDGAGPCAFIQGMQGEPPQPKQPADVMRLHRASARADELRSENHMLRQELMAAQDWQEKYRSLAADDPDPVHWRTPDLHTGTELIPILFSSDFQVGEVIRPDEIDGINEYNMHVFAERYQLMIDKTINLAEHHTGAASFPGAIYLRGGDAISGEIHEELAQTNDLSSVPALRWLRQHERDGIKRLRDKFGRVRVISIPGNHGRTTHKPHAKGYAERNFETLLSWWLADAFEDDPRVTFYTPISGDALFEVYRWKFLMSHGDRTGSRGGQGFIGPAATIARGHQKLMSNYALTKRDIDCILTGHLHTSLKLSHGYANGSLAGYSEYARDFRATPDAPKQWLLFGHDETMVSHAFELQLGPLPRRGRALAEAA